MGLFPPVGWADVATKTDLAHLEQRLDLRLDHVEAGVSQLRADIRSLSATFLTAVIALVVAFVSAQVALVKL